MTIEAWTLTTSPARDTRLVRIGHLVDFTLTFPRVAYDQTRMRRFAREVVAAFQQKC
jgi:hypothetical protein